MKASQALARYIVDLDDEQLPREVVEFAKLCVLDWLGSAFAGIQKPAIQMIAELVGELGGHGQSTLICGGRSSVVNAALLNGAASHIVELDDIHKASIIHAGTVVIPAALAVAEWKQCSGSELIAAIVAGYEVCYRIGEAVTPSHYYYWHNTATCGTFGAAAAACKLLGLSEAQIVHALGSAGTQAAGLWEFIADGAMSKHLHPGKAAMNGILSALLAEKGFTGASKILEGERGFFKAMAKEYDETRITAGLGERYKITENSFKVHASCRHTHHAIDLVLELLRDFDLDPQEIERIHVKTYQVALHITDNPQPDSVYAAKFSLQFCTALAFVKGRAGLAEFSEDSLWDPAVRDLMKRIEVSVSPDIDAAYPHKWAATLEVVKTDGDTLTRHADYPRGDVENPVTRQELIEKFKLLTGALPAAQTNHYLAVTADLERLADMSVFFSR